MILEISKDAARELGSAKRAIEAGMFTAWDNARIESCFNFGHGTQKDFERYMKDNGKFCIFQKA